MNPDSAPLPIGLSSVEAADRINQYGPNQINLARQRAAVLQFLAHIRNPLVLVLLTACMPRALSELSKEDRDAIFRCPSQCVN